MIATASSFRFGLPKKAVKGDCPNCSPRHRRTLSRYVDQQTGDVLPEQFGRCDREEHCCYHLSPYHKTTSGYSYADSLNPRTGLPKDWFSLVGKWKVAGTSADRCRLRLVREQGATDEQAGYVVEYIFERTATPAAPTPPTVYQLPPTVFAQSVDTGRYGQNQFYLLLCQQFGMSKAFELMQRFQVGTSARWPGACVFWIVDQQQRPRGGQVVKFADDWHKAKYTDHEGNPYPCISSISSCMLRAYRGQDKPAPAWLTDYHDNADRWPVPFGLHQLQDAADQKPVAIVEAPKTAVVCSAYHPGFIWLAIGGKSYLKPERLAPLRERKLLLYPDLNAYHDTQGSTGRTIKGWASLADDLRGQGFRVEVSDFLEQQATDQQRADGLDLADFLLLQPPTATGNWPPPGSTPEFL